MFWGGRARACFWTPPVYYALELRSSSRAVIWLEQVTVSQAEGGLAMIAVWLHGHPLLAAHRRAREIPCPRELAGRLATAVVQAGAGSSMALYQWLYCSLLLTHAESARNVIAHAKCSPSVGNQGCAAGSYDSISSRTGIAVGCLLRVPS